ncbi:MAG TPA: hypothetical protein VJZ26_05205 [Blastocatellia bacterium]|nr:hypothetical protein [Blastocatellia bacterium]
MIASNGSKRLSKNVLSALALVCSVTAFVSASSWRQATEKELRSVIPARAVVEKERIETEFRTASGITDGQGKFVAGVVLITAGYAAEGKYSHFLITQVPISVGEVALSPGEHVFGYKRVDDDTVEVKFYEAASGKALGAIKAQKEARRGLIRSFVISPTANGKGTMRIGRFMFEYRLSQ